MSRQSSMTWSSVELVSCAHVCYRDRILTLGSDFLSQNGKVFPALAH